MSPAWRRRCRQATPQPRLPKRSGTRPARGAARLKAGAECQAVPSGTPAGLSRRRAGRGSRRGRLGQTGRTGQSRRGRQGQAPSWRKGQGPERPAQAGKALQLEHACRGGAPACRAGHGAGGDEGRSGVPERQGLRSGWQGRERGCRLRQARRSACAALETSPGAAGRGACQTGPRRAGWRARPLAEGCRARGTNLPGRRWQALAEGLALIPCHPAGMSGGPRRAAEPCSLRLPGKCPPGLGACGGWGQKKGTCIAAGAEICGGSPETRTPNQLIKSQLLYQLS